MLANPHSFELPQELNATMPPERRGVRRDFVRMMVLNRQTGDVIHSRFYELDHFLRPGDLLVLNASRTIPAVLSAQLIREGESSQHREVEVRLAHRRNEETWEALLVGAEIRDGDILRFSPNLSALVSKGTHEPLSTLTFSSRGSEFYNQIYSLGEPVRYEYIEHPWELDYYQTVYATVPGSVEMPSAGRAFSWELLLKLQRRGIRIAYVQLHTGLSYLLDDTIAHRPEDHYEEYVIPEETARAVRQAQSAGGRVIAVGTTVVRCLETSINERGELQAGSGWTNLHIHAGHLLRIADGLITGFHEPEATHLDLLSAFIDGELLHSAYQEAIAHRYLWHEFGDMNLIL